MTMPEKLRMARTWWIWAWISWRPVFRLPPKAILRLSRRSAGSFHGCRWRRWPEPCTLDVERAAKALQDAKRPRIHTFIATSDIHLKYKLKKSRQQVLDEAVAAVSLARNYTDDVEFSAEDATRTDPDYLEQCREAVVAAGARTVNLPDTVGFSVPDEYGDLIGRMVEVLGDRAIVSVHCHDDLGLAAANSLAAVKAGARQVECTINGIGERAGNARSKKS